MRRSWIEGFSVASMLFAVALASCTATQTETVFVLSDVGEDRDVGKEPALDVGKSADVLPGKPVDKPDAGPCVPSCAGVECGDNGCGGSCGSCPAAAPVCESGKCSVDCAKHCEKRECGIEATCWRSCGTCPEAAPYCHSTILDCSSNFTECASCRADKCTPILCDAANECGPDGCGGVCGTCSAGEVCERYVASTSFPRAFRCRKPCPKGRQEGDQWCSGDKMMKCVDGFLNFVPNIQCDTSETCIYLGAPCPSGALCTCKSQGGCKCVPK